MHQRFYLGHSIFSVFFEKTLLSAISLPKSIYLSFETGFRIRFLTLCIAGLCLCFVSLCSYIEILYDIIKIVFKISAVFRSVLRNSLVSVKYILSLPTTLSETKGLTILQNCWLSETNFSSKFLY